MIEFSKRLKNVRKARSLTQEELAEKANVSRVMISRYESGTVIPTVEVLVSLADALEISIDYLLGRSEQTSFSKDLHALPSDKLSIKCLEKTTHPSLIRNPTVQANALPQTSAELREFILQVLHEVRLI